MNAQITIEKLPVTKLATISHIGEFDKAGAMFQRLMQWGHEKNVLETTDFKAITIYHDNPHVTELSKVRFSTAVTIREDIRADGDIRPIDLQSGIFAIGHFEIVAEEIPKAWQSMNMWVIESGYEFRDGVFFEVYHNDHKTHPENKFIIDICIPLKKTANLRLGELVQRSFSNKQQSGYSHEKLKDYHEMIDFMKALKAYLQKGYEGHFHFGNIYKGSREYSYFSLTTDELKKLKLKFVIVFDHGDLSFSICLSGQNKSIRKKYWEIFRGSDWQQYKLAQSIEKSLSIIDHPMLLETNFNKQSNLIEEIERESLKFINDIRDLLE